MKITPPEHMTPGPWHYTWPNGKVLGSATLEPDSTEHTPAPVIHSHHRTKATDEEKANAKAIAATPQLLAALVELEQWCRAWSKDDGDLSKKEVRANFHKFAAQQAERARQALTAAGYTITP